MKDLYCRLIMVTDTIPTLRTLSRLYSLEFTLVLKRQNVIIPHPAPKFMVCSSKRRLIKNQFKTKKSLSFFFFRSHYTTLTSCSFLFSLQQFLFCQSCLLLITLFIPALPPLVGKVQKSLTRAASVVHVFCVSVRRQSCFPENGRHGLPYQGSFVQPCAPSQLRSAPNNTSNEQHIHSCKISIISTSLAPSFSLFHKCHSCQLSRDSAFLISVSETTPSAFGISLWVDDLFFSPTGASIRHAEPGPEPKRGWEVEPRRWHRDRESDPLPGPGHCLLVQDTLGL